jgi:hypothetical protein
LTEFTAEQGIDIPLTSQDTVIINAIATTRDGRGTGSLTTSFRRVLPDLSWFRVKKFILFFLSKKTKQNIFRLI